MGVQGLTPLAMAISGILGGFIPIRNIMSTCFFITFLLITPFAFNKPFKRFINFDMKSRHWKILNSI